MKAALALFAIVLLHISGISQRSVFANFDFNKGGYALLIRPLLTPDGDRTSPPFYFKDLNSLNTITATMSLRSKDLESHQWGYAELSVLVCRRGEILESMALFSSLNILSVASTSKYYEFDGYFPLEGYELAVERKDTFRDLASARASLDSINRADGFICALPPTWKEFDGELSFTLKGIHTEKEAFMKSVQDSIESHFPGEKYILGAYKTSHDWLRGHSYKVSLVCRESLARKFDLYPNDAKEWKDFPLDLISYWER